jgi:hypothetical protein
LAGTLDFPQEIMERAYFIADFLDGKSPWETSDGSSVSISRSDENKIARIKHEVVRRLVAASRHGSGMSITELSEHLQGIRNETLAFMEALPLNLQQEHFGFVTKECNSIDTSSAIGDSSDVSESPSPSPTDRPPSPRWRSSVSLQEETIQESFVASGDEVSSSSDIAFTDGNMSVSTITDFPLSSIFQAEDGILSNDDDDDDDDVSVEE